MKILVSPYRFGWAFLLAWVFCVFYIQVVEGFTSAMPAIVEAHGALAKLLLVGLPVLSSVTTLLVLVKLEKRLGPPVGYPSFFWLAPLATALSCPLLFVQYESFAATLSLFIVGAVLTGVGSGFLWVMWGVCYARMSQDEVEYVSPVSTAVAAVLVLLVSSMSGWVSLFIVMCFPLLSGVCLRLTWRDTLRREAGTAKREVLAASAGEMAGEVATACADEAMLGAPQAVASQTAPTPLHALRTMDRAGFGILTACLFVCLLGSFWVTQPGELYLYQLVIAASILFTIAIALIATKGPRRISVTWLLRWMCPVLVLGFVAVIIWGPGTGGYIAYLIGIASRFSFCLITQMFFARFAASGRATAVQAYGFGWTFVHLGDFIGVVVIVALEALSAEALVGVNEIAAASIAVLTILTMFLISSTGGTDFDDAVQGDARSAQVGSAKQQYAQMPGRPNRQTGLFEKAEALQGEGFERRIRHLSEAHKLTPRETEVFGLLALGRSVPFIRDALVISRDTAATHVKHVYTKLDVHSRQELIDLVHE
jgi:DNA-binding CsgD family transcriptional regulator